VKERKMEPRLEDLKIMQLRPQNHQLAEELEELQMLAGGRKHPHMNFDALLQIVDPELGEPGYVIVTMDKSIKKPVGFYIGLKGDREGKQTLLTLFSGVHPDYENLGIATMMHDQARKLAGSRIKQSTIRPYNISSLIVNLNHQGFRVANRYGPRKHRFVVRGRMDFPKKEIDVSALGNLQRVNLQNSSLNRAREEIRSLSQQRRQFLLELIEERGHPLETAYKYVDWDRFRGVHVHSEGNRKFLLLTPTMAPRKASA